MGRSANSPFTLPRHLHSQERQLAIRKFNEKAKAGIAYLLERRVVPRTPDAIAEFLQGTKGLSKRRIGDYLGEPSDFNTAVLRAYTGLFDFSSMHFVEVRRARRACRARVLDGWPDSGECPSSSDRDPLPRGLLIWDA